MVGTAVTDNASAQRHLVEKLDEVFDRLGAAPGDVLADSGYLSDEDLAIPARRDRPMGWITEAAGFWSSITPRLGEGAPRVTPRAPRAQRKVLARPPGGMRRRMLAPRIPHGHMIRRLQPAAPRSIRRPAPPAWPSRARTNDRLSPPPTVRAPADLRRGFCRAGP